jgi:glycosyltransferase involved in cell wall biosynthesis
MAPTKPLTWAILTGEYPPQLGGVSDYSFLLAKALAASGDEVHVFAPVAQNGIEDHGVCLHALPSRFGPRALRQLDGELTRLKARPTLLVQYVPNAFGMKAMNLPFCLWLQSRSREPVWVMFHEVLFKASQNDSLPRRVLGYVNRVMAALVAGSAQRVFVSIPGWESLVKQVAPEQARTSWLPIFSNLPVEVDPSRVAALRAQLGASNGSPILGHFATYQEPIATCLCESLLTLLDGHPRSTVLLLGRGSCEFAGTLLEQRPDVPRRIVATGPLPPIQTSEHLAACDLLLQPYPDGISGRRGSAMAGLALGVPTITNEGRLSEPLWRESQAVSLARGFSAQAFTDAANELLTDPQNLAALRTRSRALYFEIFHIDRVVAKLRDYAEVDEQSR